MPAHVLQSRLSERWRRYEGAVRRRLAVLAALEVLSAEQALDLFREWALRNLEIQAGDGEWRPLLVGPDAGDGDGSEG